jgi:hypothetical protein
MSKPMSLLMLMKSLGQQKRSDDLEAQLNVMEIYGDTYFAQNFMRNNLKSWLRLYLISPSCFAPKTYHQVFSRNFLLAD